MKSRKANILSVQKLTANLYCICLSIPKIYTQPDAVQISGKFVDTQYIVISINGSSHCGHVKFRQFGLCKAFTLYSYFRYITLLCLSLSLYDTLFVCISHTFSLLTHLFSFALILFHYRYITLFLIFFFSNTISISISYVFSLTLSLFLILFQA